MSHNSRVFTNFFTSYSKTPGLTKANNIITGRPNTILETLPYTSQSKTLVEASMKSRRLFKYICRKVSSTDADDYQDLRV